MDEKRIAQVQLLDKDGNAIEDVDVKTSARAVEAADGQTLQQKMDDGTLKGEKGEQGTPGSRWLSGTAAPANATGAVGDWHLNTANYDIREKTGPTSWASRGNIKGADGALGTGGGDSHYIDPSSFGAKGNGTDDDTAAINTAIQTVSASGGGKIILTKKYRITGTLFIRSGVTLEGVSNSRYSDNGTILYDGPLNQSAIKVFESGYPYSMELKNITIKNHSSRTDGSFDGVELNAGEYWKVEGVVVQSARYGFLLTASFKELMLPKLFDIQAFNCDIGVFVRDPLDSWRYINGLQIGVKCIEECRIGICVEALSPGTGGTNIGNSITGDSSEIGGCTQACIQVSSGTWTVRGSLWLEQSPASLEILGGKVLIADEIFTDTPIVVKGGELEYMRPQNIYNHTVSKNIHADLKWWFSFDNLGESNVFNYATKTPLANGTHQPTTAGIYGHSSILNANFGQNVLNTLIDLSKDWTMLFLLKNTAATRDDSYHYILRARNNANNADFHLMHSMGSQGKSMVLIQDGTGEKAIDPMADSCGKFDWVVLVYDSNKKVLSSRGLGGSHLDTRVDSGSRNRNFDLSGFSQSSNLRFSGGSSLVFDEAIAYQRKLEPSEIRTITTMPFSLMTIHRGGV